MCIRLLSYVILCNKVDRRHFGMSNEHYRRGKCYSKEEAAAIVKRNNERMTQEAREACIARNKAEDCREAKELGLSLTEYYKLVL